MSYFCSLSLSTDPSEIFEGEIDRIYDEVDTVGIEDIFAWDQPKVTDTEVSLSCSTCIGY